jgi:transcriptional regulator with XRE-family HTH domain
MGGSIEKVKLPGDFSILGPVDAKLVNKRLRELRLSLELSQEAIGAQGFVSTPGWVKIENGTRQPSDALLEKLVVWLEKDRYLTKKEGSQMLDELLSLKYMNHLSPFVQRLAHDYHEALAPLALLRLAVGPAVPRKKL